jgi:hypothetical protein
MYGKNKDKENKDKIIKFTSSIVPDDVPVLSKAPELSDEIITLDWTAFNRLIELFKNAEMIYFDPMSQKYLIDGIQFTPEFFNSVINKMSHIINAISGVQGSKKMYISIESLKRGE